MIKGIPKTSGHESEANGKQVNVSFCDIWSARSFLKIERFERVVGLCEGMKPLPFVAPGVGTDGTLVTGDLVEFLLAGSARSFLAPSLPLASGTSLAAVPGVTIPERIKMAHVREDITDPRTSYSDAAKPGCGCAHGWRWLFNDKARLPLSDAVASRGHRRNDHGQRANQG